MENIFVDILLIHDDMIYTGLEIAAEREKRKSDGEVFAQQRATIASEIKKK